MNPMSRCAAVRLVAAFLCPGLAGCVIVKNVGDDQIPAAWTQAIAGEGAPFRDPSRRYRVAGQVVASDGKLRTARIVTAFFPGQFGRRERIDVVELKYDGVGTLHVAASSNGKVTEISLAVTVDAKTGELVANSVPVQIKEKFGAMAETQSVRMRLGSDGALYTKRRISGAGVLLLAPTVATSSEWGRWEPDVTAR